MPCEKFEDLLTAYSDLSAPEREPVDTHLHACEECREFLATLTALDANLTSLYRNVEPSRAFNPASVKEPSAIPELLDFCGWAAIIAILAFLSITIAANFGLTLKFPTYAAWTLAVLAATAVAVTLRSRTRA